MSGSAREGVTNIRACVPDGRYLLPEGDGAPGHDVDRARGGRKLILWILYRRALVQNESTSRGFWSTRWKGGRKIPPGLCLAWTVRIVWGWVTDMVLGGSSLVS